MNIICSGYITRIESAIPIKTQNIKRTMRVEHAPIKTIQKFQLRQNTWVLKMIFQKN